MNIVFSIATNSHLGNVRALFESFSKHHQNYMLIVGIIDDYNNVNEEIQLNDSIILCHFSELNDEKVIEMAKKYNPFEYSCALKPYFADFILKKYNPAHLIYLDSDIIVYNEFALDEILINHSIILTPHCTAPYEEMDLNLLNYGIYNAGFFVLNNDEESTRFLAWWKHNLINNCTIDLASGKYLDQIWLNLVPIYFKNVLILDDVGYNVARWNLAQRKITKRKNILFVNENSKLVFFHYSGYNFKKNVFPTDNPNLTFFYSDENCLKITDEIQLLLKKNDTEKYQTILPSYGYIPVNSIVKDHKKTINSFIVSLLSKSK